MTDPAKIRATSDTFLADLDLLSNLEAEKRHIDPADPRLVTLARQIEELSARVLETSRRQYEIASRVQAEASSGDPEAAGRPIAEMPLRDIHLILDEWREAERRAGEAKPGSLEAAVAAADVGRLRDEYRSAHERARADDEGQR